MKRTSLKRMGMSSRAGADVAPVAPVAHVAPTAAEPYDTLTALAWFGRVTAFIGLILSIIVGCGLIIFGILLFVSINVKMDFLDSPVFLKFFNIKVESNDSNSTEPVKLSTLDPGVKSFMGTFFIIAGVFFMTVSYIWYYIATINKTTGAVVGVVDGVNIMGDVAGI